MPDQLVERVVAADVLAEREQLTVGGEARRGVQPAGGVEHGLRGAQPLRAASAITDRATIGPSADRRALLLDLVEGGLAAEPAARVGDDDPLVPAPVDRARGA